MCGICGFVGTPQRPVLESMRDALTHRGPDEQGVYEDSRVSLAHRRLSILDLQQGQQPFYNANKSIVLVFNGEIYNFQELKSQLQRLGHQFRTESDTETIVAAYEEFGADCVLHLDGMFSFVLFDKQKNQLFGARDRFGKKPLYFTAKPFGSGNEQVGFAFASEIKAFKQHPVLARNMNLSEDAIVSYLTHDYVLGHRRIYAGIESLPAGSAFVFDLADASQNGFRHWKYWDIQIGAHQSNELDFETPNEAEAGQKVLELLDRAVEKRLVADVPVGALLSGGVDSSAIVALMARHKQASQIETFSIGFTDSSFDESEFAQQTADHFGTRHRNRTFSAQEMRERLPDVIRQLDEPFADPSLLPVSMLCEFAREHVTVALGGDGGDELFAGYDPFRAVRPAQWYHRMVPGWVHRSLIFPLTGLLPSSDGNLPFDFKVRRFLDGAAVPASYRFSTWMGAFSLPKLQQLMPDLAQKLTPQHVYAAEFDAYGRLANQHADELDQALDFFERFYLTDDILVKVDRASMMHSLEVRTPFLDTALAEYVNRLPSRFKLYRGTTKYLLKQALLGGEKSARLLPKNIVHRRKKGFGIPVARWIRNDLKTLFEDVLIHQWPNQKLPMIDPKQVQRLLSAHQNRKANYYKELWALFVLALWSQNQESSSEHLLPIRSAVSA